jgi:hypothetical protein
MSPAGTRGAWHLQQLAELLVREAAAADNDNTAADAMPAVDATPAAAPRDRRRESTRRRAPAWLVPGSTWWDEI